MLLLKLSHLPLAPELAPAFVIHAALRRLRLPFTVASAAALARIRPALCTVPVARLLLAPLIEIQKLQSPPSFVPPQSTRARLRMGAERVWRGLEKFDEWVGGSSMMNKYGLAYIFAGRAVGTASLVGLTLALRYGLDVETALRSLGVWMEGKGLGQVAWIFHLVPEHPSTGGTKSEVPTPFGGDNGELTTAGSAMARARATAGSAKELTILWAASALSVNCTYPLVLQLMVAGLAKTIGGALTQSPRWTVIVTAVQEGRRAAESAATLQQGKQLQEGSGGSTTLCRNLPPGSLNEKDEKGGGPQPPKNGSGGGGGIPPPESPPKKHWISKYYKTGDHCC